MPRKNAIELAIEAEIVDRRILLIRGNKVMLDSHPAEFYDVPAFRLNEAVKRNRKRFPVDLMFQLTRAEAKSLTSHFAMSKAGRGGRRTLRYAFTEQGVAMLSSVLNSDRAIVVNIAIMRAFVRIRGPISGTGKEIRRQLESDLRHPSAAHATAVGPAAKGYWVHPCAAPKTTRQDRLTAQAKTKPLVRPQSGRCRTAQIRADAPSS
jgi:hypothetical protein